jgi:beta-lactamase superfamily II metal-dependent hydrolase
MLRSISRNQSLGPWTVLHPEIDDHFAQADDNALVLAGTIQGTRILLVSDLGRPGQSALLERSPLLKADIVVTGLPTRPEALGDSFLEAVQPRLIIVVDSDYPISERASSKFSERLARWKIPVIYTRSAGSTTIEWHSQQWKLQTIGGTRMDSRTLPAHVYLAPVGVED